jgi:membrane protein
MENDLLSYAAAGAYGFLLSLIPVVILIITILIRILHASADMVIRFLQNYEAISGIPGIESIINSVLSNKTVGIFETVLFISLFWMARRFFFSIMQGIRSVFDRSIKKHPLKSNLIAIAGEIILVILIVIFILAMITANSVIDTAYIKSLLTKEVYSLIRAMLNYSPLAIMIVFIYLTYRFAAGTKPTRKLCMLAAVSCTGVFFVVQLVFKLFINMNTYNLIYGVLSSTIVILLEVYIFFVLFLFFAQMIYVIQFFDNLLLTQLYLLPGKENRSLGTFIKRSLFITPYYFPKAEQAYFKEGENIYTEHDESDDMYYILSGTVQIQSNNSLDYYDKGSFFGELAYLLETPRTETVKANTDVTLLKIKSSFFEEVRLQNPELSQRVVENFSAYIQKIRSTTAETNF